MQILKKCFGLFILLVGLNVFGWIAYNYLVAMQPEARGRNPLSALIFSGAAMWVGCKWLVSKPKNQNELDVELPKKIVRTMVGFLFAIAGFARLLSVLPSIPQWSSLTAYQLGGLTSSLLMAILAFALARQCLKKPV